MLDVRGLANSRSKTEKTLQVSEVKEVITCLFDITERAGFEPAVLYKEHTGFRNRLDQPLRHLSVKKFKYQSSKVKNAEAELIYTT